MDSPHKLKTIRKADPDQIQDSVFKIFDMHGKVTVIIGGSGSIGYEVARALAEVGSDIALWYHQSSQASKLAASIESVYGVKCKTYQCAVENFDEVRRPPLLLDNSNLTHYRSK